MEISDEGLHKFGDGTLSRVSIGLFGIDKMPSIVLPLAYSE
jgi:hypothetical protein